MSAKDLEQKLKCNGFDASTIGLIMDGLGYIIDNCDDCDLVVDYLLGKKERMLEEDEKARLIKEEESPKDCFGKIAEIEKTAFMSVVRTIECLNKKRQPSKFWVNGSSPTHCFLMCGNDIIAGPLSYTKMDKFLPQVERVIDALT